MITTTGKSIIAKYLLGQAPAFASYIAVGCGPQPLDTADTFGNYSAKSNLDFEMFRIPIVSRGLVYENDITKVVLTAELPTENRYEITEIGVFSAGSNPAVGAYSSRSMFLFGNSEGWTYDGVIPETFLTSISNAGNFSSESLAKDAFYINSDNDIFDASRTANYQRPRYLNSSLLVKGSSSKLTKSGSTLSLSGTSNKPIIITGVDLNLDRFSSEDDLRLAFSVVNSISSNPSLGAARIKIEFCYDTESATKAVFDISDVESSVGLNGNRYFVSSVKLGDLSKPADFSWASVNLIKIYVSTFGQADGAVATEPTSDFYVALDGLRIENSQSNNPIYGMTGYSVIKNVDAATILKKPNTSSYVEFRFALDVN